MTEVTLVVEGRESQNYRDIELAVLLKVITKLLILQTQNLRQKKSSDISRFIEHMSARV